MTPTIMVAEEAITVQLISSQAEAPIKAVLGAQTTVQVRKAARKCLREKADIHQYMVEV